MQGDFEEQLDKIYSILGNPYKRKIISYIGEKGEVSFTELKSFLSTSTGNLYYNLDGLVGYVAKNERRKYHLTSEGQRLYKFMVENEARLKTLVQSSGRLTALQRYVLRFLVPEEFLAVLYGQKLLSLSALILFFLSAVAASLFSDRLCFMLEVIDSRSATSLQSLALVGVGVACIFLMLALASRLLGGLGRVDLSFAGMVLLSLLPLQGVVAAGILIEDPLARSLLHRVVQVIVLGLLTAAVKVSQRLPGDRAFIAVFSAFYVSYVASILIQRMIS